MPAFVAPLVGFALGALLAWFGGAAPRRAAALSGAHAAAHRTRSQRLALAALFSGLVFTPVCAYFLAYAPDWSFAYFVDTRRIPSAFDLLLLMLDALSVPAGLLASELVTSRASSAPLRRLAAPRAVGVARDSAFTGRSAGALAALVGAPMALALLAVIVLSRRLALDGTYRQVDGDFGVQPVAGGPLGYALLWMHTMLAAGVAVTLRALLAPKGARPRAEDPRPADVPVEAPVPEAPRPEAPRPEAPLPARRLGVGRKASPGRPGRGG